MRVSKQIKFDAAHWLPNYEGKCANLHGHTWTVEVTCSGRIDLMSGMVVDFSKLKDFLQFIERRFDHKYLNDILPNPTAENICLHIQGEFEEWCRQWGVKWESVKVWEGLGGSYVGTRREDEK